MADDRWVILGLAHPRAVWFGQLAQWSNSGTINAEFIKCLSGSELRARLESERPHSAVIVDLALTGLDRDLLAVAEAHATPVLVVADPGREAEALALDAAGVLPPDFDVDQLGGVLRDRAVPVADVAALPTEAAEAPASGWQAKLLVCVGPGGTGASTVAMALAQGMAAHEGSSGLLVLADLARRADLGVLHDAGELGPGLQELVEAHRRDTPTPEQVRGFTFDVEARGYRLLLGLRRPAAWSAIRPRATDAALAGLRRAFQTVVADVTGDLEGEDDGGSLDVEERNHLARSAIASADLVLAVGTGDVKGVHSLGSLVREVAHLAPEVPVMTVINRATRSPGGRAEIAKALARSSAAEVPSAPVWLPEKRVDEAIRDAAPIPRALVSPLVDAASATLRRNGRRGGEPSRFAYRVPARITPGSLGLPEGDDW